MSRLEPDELVERVWGPWRMERSVLAARTVTYRFGSRAFQDLGELSVALRTAVEGHRARGLPTRVLVGDIEAVPTVPYKFVVAVLNKMWGAGIRRFDWADLPLPSRDDEEAAFLFYPTGC